MPFPPTAIQTFAGAHTIQSSSNTQCAVDWQRGLIYIADEINRNVSAGITQSGLLSGAENSFALFSTLDDPTNHIGITAPLTGLDANGQIYLEFGSGLLRLDPATWTVQETWGTHTSSIGPGLPTTTINGGMSNGQIINVPVGSTQFNIACGEGGFFSFLNVAYWMQSCQFNGLAFEWLGTKQVTVSGKSGSGKAYMFSGFNSPSDTSVQFDSLGFALGSSWVPADWPATNPQMTQTTIKTYVPTDIDSGWTEIQALGVCLDQTDGNPIVVFTGQSAASPNRYVVKVNATTGAVIWKTQIIGSAFSPGLQWSWTRIRFSKLYLVIPNQSGTPPNTVQTIDTSTGSSSSYTTGLSDLVIFGPQSSDDGYGAVVLNTNWTSSGAGSPTPLNASAAPFTGWALLYVAAPPPAPANPRRFLAECGPIRVIQ